MQETVIARNHNGLVLTFNYERDPDSRGAHRVMVRPSGGTIEMFPAGFAETGCCPCHNGLKALLYLAVHHIRGALEEQNAELPEAIEFRGPQGDTHLLRLCRY